MTALILTVALAAPTPVDSWEAHWHAQVAEAGGLTVGLVEDRRTFYALFEPEPVPVAPAVRAVPRVIVPPVSVEVWRSLVAAHFPAEHVDAALSVMACESHGDTYAANPRSTARGLFQFLRGWWSGAWGYPAFDPYNPELNVAAAAWLSKGGTDWSHWVCKP
jgi:hypothetical protein